MVGVAIVVSSVALGVSLFLALAMIELVNAQRQVAPRIDKEIIDLGLSEDVVGHHLTEFGLEELSHPTGMILLLSPTCTACQRLADTFAGVIPSFVRVLITAGEPNKLRKWAEDRRLPLDEVVFDDNRLIADQLTISSSPSIIGVYDNTVAFAVGVSNSEAFGTIYDQMLEASSEFARRAGHLESATS